MQLHYLLKVCCFISLFISPPAISYVTDLDSNQLAIPTINDFTHDINNTMWLATENGVFNYDGHSLFSNQTAPFSNLPSQSILQISAYKSWLLINTTQGLSLINLINNQLVQLTNTPITHPILNSEQGFLFLLKGQLYTIKEEKLHQLLSLQNPISNIALGYKNHIWIHSQNNRISHFDLATNRTTTEFTAPQKINQLAPSTASPKLIYKTEQGNLYLIDNNGSTQKLPNAHKNPQQLQLLNGQLYYLHKQQAFVFNLKTNKAKPLFYNSSNRFIATKQSNDQLWLQLLNKNWLTLPQLRLVSTPITNSPVPRIQQYYKTFTQIHSLSLNKTITKIHYLRDEKWAIATNQELYLYDASLQTFDLILNNEVSALNFTLPASLLVATKGQLLEYNLAQKRTIERYPVNEIIALTSLSKTHHIAATNQHLFYVANGQITPLTLLTKPEGQINNLHYQASSSTFLLATTHGLWEGELQLQNENILKDITLNLNKISAIPTFATYEAPKNALWVSDTQGIKLYHPVDNQENEIANNNISANIVGIASNDHIANSPLTISYRDKIILYSNTNSVLLEAQSNKTPPLTDSLSISKLTLHYQHTNQSFYHLATNAVQADQPLKGATIWFGNLNNMPAKLSYRLTSDGEWQTLPISQNMLSLSNLLHDTYLEVKNLNQENSPPLALHIKQTAFLIPNWFTYAAIIFGISLILILFFIILKQKNSAKHNLSNALMAQSKDAIWIADEHLQITQINPAFTHICGYKPEDVIGKKPKLLTINGRDHKLENLINNELEADGYWSGEIWNLRKDGQPYALDLSITKVQTPNLRTSHAHYIGLFSDVTARKNNERAMLRLTIRDTVTGLSNRVIFIESVNKAIASCNNNFPNLLIIFIDLDNFKKINDSLGHSLGDELLKEVAGRLTQMLDSGFTLARLGGDEFAVLVPPYLYSGMTIFFAKKLADNILKQFQAPFLLNGIESSISACCGIATYPDNGYTSDALMRSANSALNHAKKMGHNNYQFFDKSKHTIDPNTLSKESALFRAIENDDFQLFYQPKYDVNKDQIHGFEALVRWPQEGSNIISPAEFIPIAEQNGAIIPLTLLLMKQLFKQLEIWRSQDVNFGKVAINISALHFQQSSLVETLTECLTNYDVPARCVELEITESAMMDNPEFAQQQMNRLKALGFTIALDDFGTGHSSLGYLKRFPIDTLKIDRSFIKDIVDNEQDRNITATIIRLAKYLNIDVIAEGVETKAQAYMLHVMGCSYMQGYYYSRPLHVDKVAEFVNKSNAPKDTDFTDEL
ncbi:EAL domain-containing protein [Pseudoalteromonas sp. NEC-BIFX-2020_015]|uniref:GGDEF domain-containing phosphodiesterase n=1 Tax=Pseudoalteromonas sp. NEC-BIFX-2020_015 TaxID=2729544 RepID=UPI00146138C5|nr:GGDEF domain-containing phosphodiesterase [Pseudoalteromonas sp. NEC-BIFX-2020_015]NMR26304.1 EAL domain-containing protein [Pseudoalteromonas sp. NEC-BIFX-2020_015]